MKNLAGDSNAENTILEELYLAGIPAIKVPPTHGEVKFRHIGKIGSWTFTRRWSYWSASVEKNTEGLPLDIALQLHNKKHPTNGGKFGDVIRSGGHGGAPSPEEYGAQPIFNDELNAQLESLGYKKVQEKLLGIEYIPIACGEISRLCNEGKLTVQRYVDCYHIDDQIGLKELADTLNLYIRTTLK